MISVAAACRRGQSARPRYRAVGEATGLGCWDLLGDGAAMVGTGEGYAVPCVGATVGDTGMGDAVPCVGATVGDTGMGDDVPCVGTGMGDDVPCVGSGVGDDVPAALAPLPVVTAPAEEPAEPAP